MLQLAVPLAANEGITLLELMPGALLKAVGLPCRNYKGGRRALELRTRICGGLAAQSGVPLPNLDAVRMGCRANDDCLDAVVAAVGTAMWAQDCRQFRHPAAGKELATAQLEGWLYAPSPEP